MKINNLLENTYASIPDPGQTAFRSGRSETSLEEMTAGGSVGATVAGSVATVAKPMGKVIKRESGITKGIKKKLVDEGEITENDLIMVPGQMSKRSKGFVSKDRNEMERIEMAKSDVVQSVKSAKTIYNILKRSNDEVEGWVQEKLSKAEDYLNTVREYLEGKLVQGEARMSPGVRMQRALQREKEKRERSEEYARQHFPIGTPLPKPNEKQKDVSEGEGPQDWMDELKALAHKMAPQDKLRQAHQERMAQDKERAQKALQQDIENLPELISQYNDMKSEYESLGGSNWQYADREQNLTSKEHKARGMETSLRQLSDRIHRAKKASEGLSEAANAAQQAAIAISMKKKGQKPKKVDEIKQRLDPSCWKDHHKEGTKIKGGVRVNNCVPNESVAEGSDKLQGTPVVSLSDFGDKDNTKDKYGRTVPKKLKKDDPRVKFNKEPKKQGVAEGSSGAKYKVKSIGTDKKGDYYISPKSGQKVYKKNVSVGDHEVPDTGEIKKKVVGEESKGLWANIHAKRERIKHSSGEHMRKPGSKGAPTADALRKSAK